MIGMSEAYEKLKNNSIIEHIIINKNNNADKMGE